MEEEIKEPEREALEEETPEGGSEEGEGNQEEEVE